MLRGDHTDEELMALYQDGAAEAFKTLYYRHAGKILGYLKSRTESNEEAADLFQEVFVKIHRSKHLYNRSLPVLPWIFSVTHSVFIDGRRGFKRKKEVFDYDFNQLPSVEVADGNLSSITPFVDYLPKSQSMAIQMRYLEEKTFEEIATTLRTSPLNVRQIISRGVKSLKRLMNGGEKP